MDKKNKNQKKTQYNGQEKTKTKRTNNDRKITTQNTKY